jgi:hypothetical protein
MNAAAPVRGVFRFTPGVFMLLALAIAVLTPNGWVPPEQATTVRVLRGTQTPFIAVADVLPTDRVSACSVAPVAGSCPKEGRAPPNQNDIWWLASEVFVGRVPVPVPAPELETVEISWPAVTEDVNGVAITGISYQLYFGQQGQEALAQPNLITNKTTAIVQFGLPYCGWVLAVFQGVASDESPRGCITLTKETPNTPKPKAPESLELKSTTTRLP